MTQVRVSETALDGDFTVRPVTGHVEAAELTEDVNAIPVPGEHFLRAMRMLASGVVLVTTRVDGRPWGLTISSCTSLTLEPPQILVSLQSSTMSCRSILRHGGFGVSVLGEHQEELARVGAATGAAKFVDDYCSSAPGHGDVSSRSPAVIGALCHLDCGVARAMEISSHTVLAGLVTCMVVDPRVETSSPLVYVDRRFARPEPLEAA